MQQLSPTALPSGITLGYRTPATLGADRLAAVMGAQSLLPHRTVFVIDAGTCITFDLLLSNGHYLGGNISPGLDMRLRAMHEFTARLPLISAEGENPDYGYDTITALRSGAKKWHSSRNHGLSCTSACRTPGCLRFFNGGQPFRLSAFPQKVATLQMKSDAIATDNRIFADEYLVARGLNALS